MDKNFETMLKYQEYDIKLKRMIDALEKSDANKRMEHARNEFNNAKKTVMDSEKEAENVVLYYEQITPQIKELCNKIDEIKNKSTEDSISNIIEQLETIRGKLVTLEKRIADCKSSSEKLLKTYQEATAIGNKMLTYYNNAKASYSEQLKASEPEISSLKKQMRALEPQIDEETMKKYKEITRENKYPAFVEVRVSDKTYSCGACGLQLSQKNTSTLNENGICTCETCRRIIFKR